MSARAHATCIFKLCVRQDPLLKQCVHEAVSSVFFHWCLCTVIVCTPPSRLEVGDSVLLGLHFARGREARAPAFQVQEVAFLGETDNVETRMEAMSKRENS